MVASGRGAIFAGPVLFSGANPDLHLAPHQFREAQILTFHQVPPDQIAHVSQLLLAGPHLDTFDQMNSVSRGKRRSQFPLAQLECWQSEILRHRLAPPNPTQVTTNLATGSDRVLAHRSLPSQFAPLQLLANLLGQQKRLLAVSLSRYCK
jgi:hypothetical protein